MSKKLVMGVRSLRAVGTWTKESEGRGRLGARGGCGGVATRDCWRYIDQLLYRALRYFRDIKYCVLLEARYLLRGRRVRLII